MGLSRPICVFVGFKGVLYTGIEGRLWGIVYDLRIHVLQS